MMIHTGILERCPRNIFSAVAGRECSGANLQKVQQERTIQNIARDSFTFRNILVEKGWGVDCFGEFAVVVHQNMELSISFWELTGGKKIWESPSDALKKFSASRLLNFDSLVDENQNVAELFYFSNQHGHKEQCYVEIFYAGKRSGDITLPSTYIDIKLCHGHVFAAGNNLVPQNAETVPPALFLYEWDQQGTLLRQFGLSNFHDNNDYILAANEQFMVVAAGSDKYPLVAPKVSIFDFKEQSNEVIFLEPPNPTNSSGRVVKVWDYVITSTCLFCDYLFLGICTNKKPDGFASKLNMYPEILMIDMLSRRVERTYPLNVRGGKVQNLVANETTVCFQLHRYPEDLFYLIDLTREASPGNPKKINFSIPNHHYAWFKPSITLENQYLTASYFDGGKANNITYNTDTESVISHIEYTNFTFDKKMWFQSGLLIIKEKYNSHALSLYIENYRLGGDGKEKTTAFRKRVETVKAVPLEPVKDERCCTSCSIA